VDPITQSILLVGAVSAAIAWAWSNRLTTTARLVQQSLERDGGEAVALADLIPKQAGEAQFLAGSNLLVTAVLASHLHGLTLALVILVAVPPMAVLALRQLPPAGGQFFRLRIRRELRRAQLRYQRRGDEARSGKLAELVLRVR
jgi:hypothetical protein